MFCNKRNSLIKQLWKYKVNDETKSPSQIDPSSSSTKQSPRSSHDDLELKSVTHSFFTKLKEDQLKTLLLAMESKGGEVTPCVPVSKSDVWLGRQMVSPYVLCCQVFRWPDLSSEMEMKRLPSCSRQDEKKESVICCNPYHWSLVVKLDEHTIETDKLMVSPKQSRRIITEERNEDKDPRIMKSAESEHLQADYQDEVTDNTNQSSEHNSLAWCTVAYWELRERVGRLFSINESSLHVFQHLPHGDGMCLKLFQKPTKLEVVKRTREKIGFGIILSREAAQGSNVDTVQTMEIEMDEEIMASAPPTTEITVSTLSGLLPPSSESACLESGTNKQEYKITDFLTTSNSKMATSVSAGFTKCDDNLVLNVLEGMKDITSSGCSVNMVESSNDADSVLDRAQLHLQEQHQNVCGSDSTHVSRISDENLDYMSTFSTFIPSQVHSQPLQPQSMLASTHSSFLSSPLSLPLYINDTVVNYTSYSTIDSDHDSWFVNKLMNKTIHNNKANLSWNKKNNSNKRTTTWIPTENSNKNSRITYSQTTSSSITTAGSTQTTTSSGMSSKQEEVWAYNASNFPIFVNSPTLDDPQSPQTLVIRRVPPGYSIKIFDYARAEVLERTEARNMLLNDGPFDPCSVRISLAKGWGPNYSRQFITSCPCWLEILLGVRKQSSSIS